MAIKVLVVDDSALMRRQLKQLLETGRGFEVRTAQNGKEAVELNLSWEPDVITLDINMPMMDGLTALAHIMDTRPVPVVMVSSLTENGALATFEALALGAVDYIAKPGGTISLSLEKIAQEILTKVKVAARARLKTPGRASGLREKLLTARQERHEEAPRAGAAAPPELGPAPGLVIIGVSTGGPSTLEQILPQLPADFPYPVIVAQHMPKGFTGPFAARLNAQCPLEVVEASRPTPVEAGCVYIGKGGADVVVARRAGRLMVLPKPESPQYLWHPSVEMLARSVLENYAAERVIAVMLTGMGYDGAEAFAELKKRGARTIAESEDSAVVFGMPKELIARGGASLILPMQKIASQLVLWARR